MSNRAGTIVFQAVNISLVQDLINALAVSAKQGFEVLSFGIGTKATVGEGLAFSLRVLKATVTNGSGGNTATIQPDDDRDTLTTTARINDSTTTASSSGGTQVVFADILQTTLGFVWIFPRDARPIVQPNEACILRLDEAPTSPPLKMSGHLKIREF